MMDSDAKFLYLLEEVRAKISLLERAVDEVDLVKKCLKLTAADVKSQIRDSISRHLESLRNRETWLLSQVEVVQHGKEDVLRQQQGELNQAVGSLKNMCALLEQNHEKGKLAEVESLEMQLRETLMGIEKMSRHPEESDCIHFKGLNLELLENIRRFGMVGTDGSQLESRIAASFKEMRLDECESTAKQGRKRKYFTPTGPTNNWLLKGKGPFVQRSLSVPGTLSTCAQEYLSVEKWLTRCHIESESEVESVSETEFGESAEPKLRAWLLYPKSLVKVTSSKPDAFLGYFQDVKLSGCESWVKKPSKMPQLKTSVVGETYAKIAALGPENWLAYKQKLSKQRSMSEVLKQLQVMRESNPDMWLKKVDQKPVTLKSSLGMAYAEIAATGPDQWLPPRNVNHEPEKPRCNSSVACSDCECWLVSASADNDSTRSDSYDSESLSDADWLTVNKKDVVPIENLDTIFLLRNKSNDENQTWLCGTESKSLTNDSRDQSVREKSDKLLQPNPSNSWLMNPSNRDAEIETDSCMKGYLDSLPSDYNKWLASPQPSPEICKWLARSSLDRCKNCPKMCSKDLFSIFKSVGVMDSGDWLKKLASS